ncbi:hypothetical protein EYF80_002215 [Liparis tanakae]|uniref:Uncharacterized protein n=1 Tax=Liparis tanakae TaxID=230148 RepID=A0A4Z2JCY7_9TELE|nr:hypothetical protein EYF80_002215 [Liparis tanakae]
MALQQQKANYSPNQELELVRTTQRDDMLEAHPGWVARLQERYGQVVLCSPVKCPSTPPTTPMPLWDGEAAMTDATKEETLIFQDKLCSQHTVLCVLKIPVLYHRTSSLAMRMSSFTLENTVGSMKNPFESTALPPHSILAPSLMPLSMNPNTRFCCSRLICGGGAPTLYERPG